MKGMKTLEIISRSNRVWLLLLTSLSLSLPILLAETAQSQEKKPQTTEQKKVRRPLKPTFFEEQRRVFGFGDFLNSALDGADNAFGSSSANNIGNTPGRVEGINGALTVYSRDRDSSNFLNITFDLGNGTGLTFFNAIQTSNGGRIGTIQVISGPILPNGTPPNPSQAQPILGGFIFNGQRVIYNGSYDARGNLVTGAVLLVDPGNANNTMLLQLPVGSTENASDNNKPITAGAVLSIGSGDSSNKTVPSIPRVIGRPSDR